MSCIQKLIINYVDVSIPHRAGIGRISSSSAYIAAGKSIGVDLRPSFTMFEGEFDDMHRFALAVDADHGGRK